MKSQKRLPLLFEETLNLLASSDEEEDQQQGNIWCIAYGKHNYKT